MPFSRIIHSEQYTSDDWRVMHEALKIAAEKLKRDIKHHEHSDRLARSVMRFFDQGVREIGVLSNLAVSRERSLEGIPNRYKSELSQERGDTPSVPKGRMKSSKIKLPHL